jgi:ribulose-bisphosphate carboxylase large chain
MEYSYLNLRRKPIPRKEVLVSYLITPPKGVDLAEVAQKVAAESSIGTWTAIKTLSPKIFRELAAYVYDINEEQKIVKIGYPLGLFELGSLPQMASSILGNIFSMKELEALRVLDIEFPVDYINSFDGPTLGSSGVRALMNINDRPIVGAIMKPKIGLNPKENAALAYDIWSGGVDLIKDDENLTDLPISPFEKRVAEIMKIKRKVERRTGENKLYAFNITGPIDRMIKRGQLVAEQGGRCIMVDIIPAGWAGVQEVARRFPQMSIHGHRAGHSSFTRSSEHGQRMLIVAKMARLAGVDQLHTGTVVGKMDGEVGDVLPVNDFLKSEWGALRPVMPIASGGLHPGLIPDLVKILGRDLIINFGGGIHGHPDGSGAGAEAARAAVEAAAIGEPLIEAAKRCQPLARALTHWSYWS